MKQSIRWSMLLLVGILLSGCYTQRLANLEAKVKLLESENYNLRLERQYQSYLEYGPTYVLHNLNFTNKGSRLLPSSYYELDKVVHEMARRQQQVIRIICHTDDLGSAQYNYQLSIRRLNAIQDYLVARGVTRERIVSVGQGEFWPIANTDSWTGRQENQRIEVQFAQR